MSSLIAVADALAAPDPAPVPLRQFWFSDAAHAVVRWHDRMHAASESALESANRVLAALRALPAQRVGRCLNAPVPRWCLQHADDQVAMAGAALAACDAAEADLPEMAGLLHALPGTLAQEASRRWLDTSSGRSEPMRETDRVSFGGGELLLAQRDALLGGTAIDAHAKVHDDDACRHFRARLAGALDLLQSATPGFARSLHGLIRAVVPMQAPVRGVPSTSTNAVPGAICLTATDDEALLAEQFTHESTHTLLFLLQESDPLLDADRHGDGWGDPLVYSPWRDDARPLNGLLHGAAVFLRVAWLHARLAERQSSSRRRLAALAPQVRLALEGLQAHATMTPTGRRLLLGMLESDRMLAACRPEWAGDATEPLYMECSSILNESGPASRRQAAHRERATRGAERP